MQRERALEVLDRRGRGALGARELAEGAGEHCQCLGVAARRRHRRERPHGPIQVLVVPAGREDARRPRQRIEAVVDVVALLPAPEDLATVLDGSVLGALEQLEPGERPGAFHLGPEHAHLTHDRCCLHDAQARGPALAAAGVDLAHDDGRDRPRLLVGRGVVEQAAAEGEAAPPFAALPQHVAEAGGADVARRRDAGALAVVDGDLVGLRRRAELAGVLVHDRKCLVGGGRRRLVASIQVDGGLIKGLL